jgi:hypothetical protein
MKWHIYVGFLQIFSLPGKFVQCAWTTPIGLILGVREYHAVELITNTDLATDMTSIIFQGRVYDAKCSE